MKINDNSHDVSTSDLGLQVVGALRLQICGL